MQSMLNLRVTHGVPLCLSGITNPLPLPMEIADHERRRKAMKRQRSLARKGVHANHQQRVTLITIFENYFLQIMAEEYGDLDEVILHHLFHTHIGSTAKAA